MQQEHPISYWRDANSPQKTFTLLHYMHQRGHHHTDLSDSLCPTLFDSDCKLFSRAFLLI